MFGYLNTIANVDVPNVKGLPRRVGLNTSWKRWPSPAPAAWPDNTTLSFRRAF
jgi:hypothetical protein